MDVGKLVLGCLWLALGQPPADEPVFENHRALKVPIVITDPARRAEVKDLRLFTSTDKGRSWVPVSMVTPEREHFEFNAPGDGTYWLRIVMVNLKGQQEPVNLSMGPPDEIIVIDTAAPIIHTLEARRSGDQVVVSWQLQEEFPDWKSFQLEYQLRGAPTWTPIQVQPSVSGQRNFSPGSQVPLTVRLTLRDRAGNSAYKTAEVDGQGSVAAAPTPPAAPPAAEQLTPLPPALPTNIALPPAPAAPPGRDPYLTKVSANGQARAAEPGSPLHAQANPNFAAPPAPAVVPAAPPTAPPEKVVADSQWAPPAMAVDPKPLAPASSLPQAPVPGPPAGVARKLPPLQYVNQPKLTIEFEVARLGPSGLGALQLWYTRNDGQKWELYAEDRNPGEVSTTGRQPLSVQLEEEAAYGFVLVAKNRLGLGKAPPRDGDVPEMRVELDTTPPVARLFAPQPDPSRPDALLLTWEARDKNPGDKPINLEWAEKPEGPWQPIGLDLANTGRHAWQPKGVPVQVYLRLRVRDAAGNESAAVTREPQPIDLSEPEVHLLSVVQPQRP